MDDPHFPHHASSIAEMLVHQFDADVEILTRRVASKTWDKDRSTKALMDCRALLVRASEIMSRECYTMERAALEQRILLSSFGLGAWATIEGLDLPHN